MSSTVHEEASILNWIGNFAAVERFIISSFFQTEVIKI